jgi:hypothetical protein
LTVAEALLLFEDRLRSSADNEVRFDTSDRTRLDADFGDDDDDDDDASMLFVSNNGLSDEREVVASLEVLRIILGKDLRQVPRDGGVVDMLEMRSCDALARVTGVNVELFARYELPHSTKN